MEQTRLVRFDANQVLFREGETTREMYIIRSGKVQVSVSKNKKNIPFITMGKGSFVGEMSFISGIPRTATVVALEPVIANVITTDILQKDEMSIFSWTFSIAKVLVERIRKTTLLLADYIIAEKPLENREEKTVKTTPPFFLEEKDSKDTVRLYLKGFLGEKSINSVKSKIREVKLKNPETVVLDFSEVIDIDKSGLGYLLELTQNNSGASPAVRIENVQLIRNKVLSIKGIMNIITSTQAPQKRIKAGEVLIRQDDIENTMYVVKNGRFSIYREVNGEEVSLGHAEAGDVIGEMSLIEVGKRSAFVRAEQASVVYVIQTHDFYANMYNVPKWFLDLIKGLVQRLRHTNTMLETIIKNRKKKVKQSEWVSPFCIVMDSGNPGKFILQGNLVFENLEYLALIIHSLIDKGTTSITLDLTKVKTMDSESIMYLLHLSLDLKRRDGTLSILGPQKDLLKLSKQYDLE